MYCRDIYSLHFCGVVFCIMLAFAIVTRPFRLSLYYVPMLVSHDDRR